MLCVTLHLLYTFFETFLSGYFGNFLSNWVVLGNLLAPSAVIELSQKTNFTPDIVFRQHEMKILGGIWLEAWLLLILASWARSYDG